MANRQVVPNDTTLKYYFYFIQERMNIFWSRYSHRDHLTDDPILQEYKFTNVYRASDRVSQYLIKNVIYKELDRYTPEDVLLRILVFKVFNRIETWEYLNMQTDIRVDSFNVDRLTELLTKRRKEYPIFSNAYMMAGKHACYADINTKHQVWLQMIEDRFIQKRGFEKVLNSKSTSYKRFMERQDKKNV